MSTPKFAGLFTLFKILPPISWEKGFKDSRIQGFINNSLNSKPFSSLRLRLSRDESLGTF